jgi:hypothetical protein
MALLAIPITRRAIGGGLVGSLALAGCGGGGSYTDRHCVAFEEAVKAVDPAVVINEVAALATPPEGETVEPSVQRAAKQFHLALTAGFLPGYAGRV